MKITTTTKKKNNNENEYWHEKKNENQINKEMKTLKYLH